MNTEKQGTELIVKRFRKMNVKKVGPTHCTGDDAEDVFEQEYKKDFIRIRVGDTIEI